MPAPARAIDDFLGSAHVFASAVDEVVEARLLREVAGDQVTVSQLKLLKLVAMTDAQTIGDVALFLGVSNAAASKAVDKLVRRKLLRRAEGEKDRRVIHLSLTPASRRVLGAYEQAKEQVLAGIFQKFSEQDLRRTADLLDRLSADIVQNNGQDEMCLQCGIYFRERCLVRQIVQRNCFYKRHKRGENNGTSGGPMCLAVPGKILSTEDRDGSRVARVQFGGIVRQVYLDFVPEAEVGDFVVVHVGFALSRVDADEAARTYELLQTMGLLEGELAPDPSEVK